MAVYNRKKLSRARGSKTHGGGSMKKRRGAGHRGGRGAAGSGKRGDGKKPSFWKDQKYFSGRKFKSINPNTVNSINLSLVADKLFAWQDTDYVSKDKDKISIDLSAAGYDKLLGSGKAPKGAVFSVKSASKKAVEKVEAAGGKVTILDN